MNYTLCKSLSTCIEWYSSICVPNLCGSPSPLIDLYIIDFGMTHRSKLLFSSATDTTAGHEWAYPVSSGCYIYIYISICCLVQSTRSSSGSGRTTFHYILELQGYVSVSGRRFEISTSFAKILVWNTCRPEPDCK